MTQVRELIKQAQSGDKTARNRLIVENTGLVRSIVNRFSMRGADREDLFQIGVIGLIKAIDYFDLNYDVQFSTYAVPRITGEIRRFLRDDGMIRVSRSIKDNRVIVNRTRTMLMEKNGREPKLSEIASQSGLSMEDVLMATNSAQEIESLHQTIYEGDGSSISLMDKIPMKGNEGDETLNRMMISETLSSLDDQERKIIVLRFYFDETQSQIAARLGVSQVQISRLEKKILKKMKALIG